MPSAISPLARLGRLVRHEKSEISSIYFFALLGGLIQLSLPLGIQSLIGFAMGGAMSTSLVLLIVFIVMGVACNGVLQLNQMKFIERIQQKLFVRYSFAFTSHIPHLDLHKTDDVYLPELVNRFFDISVLQKSISKILLDFPLAITQILLGLLLLAFYHPWFIAFGILLLLVLLGIFYLTGNKGIQTSLAKSTHKYAVAAWLEEMARVVRQFKFSISTGLHTKRADENMVNYLKARKEHFSILLLQYKVLIAFKVLITTAMLVVGCLLLLNQEINIGQFVAAEIVIIIVLTSVEKLMINLDSVYSALTSVEKISNLLDKPVESEGSLQMTKGAVAVEFKNVSFGYDERETILKDFSAIVAAGDKVIIGGANGSGKSTVLKLLTGSYQHGKGSILLNNIPIGNYNLQSLRSHTGILLNHDDIFAGTLKENISMDSAAIDDGYLLFLCRQTGLYRFIASQRKGLDTPLQTGGKGLPRGIIQRILLVRCLLSKPSLLLLEEPLHAIKGDDRQQILDLLLHLPDATVMMATTDSELTKVFPNTIHLTQFS